MRSESSPSVEGGVPHPELRIRDGRVEDAPSIEAVHFDSREAVYAGKVVDWPPAGSDKAGRIERWRRWLSDPAIVCLVGEIGEEIVGFCTTRRSGDEDAGQDVAEMPTLYIRPDAWHLGYGRALCRGGLERAAIAGFTTLTLWVLEINTRARAFYLAFGFTADEVTKVDVGSTEQLLARRYRIDLSEREG
jgi:ribosomal protein S18 acetylase RimI-like enzyme